MNYREYLDKIHGGWLGKCLGGAAGAPVEGFKRLIETPHYSETIRIDLPNDDLDLQLLWLEVMQKKGIHITSEDLAEAWDKQCWYPFSEYGLFLRNYDRRILPPVSGWFNNPIFKEGEGCPIRSEIWAMIFPGYPEKAAEYAYMDGVLDHADASVWIEQYYAAMEAAAFYEQDIEKLILDHLHYLPEGSAPRKCVELVLHYYKEDPVDWQRARTKLIRKYAHNEFTNSVPNLGLVILALLYGERDLDRTVNIAFRCGYDADCTCATAGALLGIVLGAERIPAELKRIAGDTFVAGIAVERTDMTIAGLARETALIGLGVDAVMERRITEIPQELAIPVFPDNQRKVGLRIEYLGLPSVAPEKPCRFKVHLTNNTAQEITDTLTIEGLPQGWRLSENKLTLTLAPREEKTLELSVSFEEGKELADKNVLLASFAGEAKEFGISGCAVWQAIGPYMEQLVKGDYFTAQEEAEGGTPDYITLECMVNNAAYLEKEYIDESRFAEAFAGEDAELVYASEDLLPMDEIFTFHGQGCFYLRQELISPEDREIWAVVGNNDGFAIWVNGEEVYRRDEIRLLAPYNNYFPVKLKKGSNEIVLKLLRRTESLKFSIGWRKNEGDHFHRKRWFVDMATRL